MSKITTKFYSLKLNVENQKVVIPNIYVIRFPQRLYTFLASIKSAKTEGYKNAHISPLSRAIRSKFSDIITTDDRINQLTLGLPWIYSFEKIDIEILKVIIQDWLEEQLNYKNKGERIIIPSEVMDEMDWHEQSVELDFQVNALGTVEPMPSSIAYNFLVSYLAHKLSGNLCVNTIGKRKDGKNTPHQFDFYHVNTSPKGAELISWPFITYQGFSWTYRVVLSLQIVPFSSNPFLNIEIELLRFCKDKITTRNHKGITAYVKIPGNRVSGNCKPAFIKAYLSQYQKINEDNTWCWKWENGFMQAANAMFYGQLIPSAQQLISEPQKYLSALEDETCIAVPLGSHLYSWTPVGAGVSFFDEAEIANSVKKAIIELNDPISGVIGDFLILEDIYKANQVKNLKGYVKFRLSRMPNIIEAYYYSEDWLSKCLMYFDRAFACDDYLIERNDMDFVFKNEEGIIEKVITIKPINMLEWNAPGSDFFQIKPIKEAYDSFIRAFKSKIESSQEPIGALFELPYEVKLENRKRLAFQDLIDPKNTIRKLMAEKNRLVQFITPPEYPILKREETSSKLNDKDAHKFTSGVKDLMRQLGVINKNISDLKTHGSDGITYIGLWFYTRRKTRNFPILVAIVNNEPYLSFYKEDEKDVHWYKYTEGQIQLAIAAGEAVERNSKYNNTKLNGFIVKAIEDLKSKANIEDVVFYAVAQNCRSYLPWFTNSRFGGPDATLTISYLEDDEKYNNQLRGQSLNNYLIVRLRNKDSYETPGWTLVNIDNCGEVIDMPNSFHKGVFKINQRVFYSVQGKQDSYRPGGEHVRSAKVDSPEDEFKRTGVLEISVPSIKEGVLSEIDVACLTHFLREDTSFQYKGSTEFPLPVHLARTACEYADAYYEKLKFKAGDGALATNGFIDSSFEEGAEEVDLED